MSNDLSILAWHFTGDTLRDGRDIPAVGEVLRHEGPIELCALGLHASERAIDALAYAPGPMIHRVRCGVDIQRQQDKLVCRERAILWSANAEIVLRAFARSWALSVRHLWDMPQIVATYLETGDESLRSAAESAARSAVWSAAMTFKNDRIPTI